MGHGCRVCKPGFYRRKSPWYDKNECVGCHDSACANCSGGQGNCSGCKEGFAMKDNVCIECKGNSKIVDGQCVVSCKDGSDNCSICHKEPSEGCLICENGFGLKGQTCSKCRIENCAKCNDDTNTCNYCKKGFILENNACKACPKEGCKQCGAGCVNCNGKECLKCKGTKKTKRIKLRWRRR